MYNYANSFTGETIMYAPVIVPRNFQPPKVSNEKQGIEAFHRYDWYFDWMKKILIKSHTGLFLVPCAKTKPIYSSSFHRNIYQKMAVRYGLGRAVLVVSEPVGLILYRHLRTLESAFMYEFPPIMLCRESRNLFIERLREMLIGKDVRACLLETSI